MSESSTPNPESAQSPNLDDTDLYELLGVEKTATSDEIKKAYRKLALQHHPDKVPEEQREEAEAKFKAFTSAFEILRDDEKRDRYDTHGMAAFDPSLGGGGGGPEVDIHDILSQMFGVNVGGPSNGPRRSRQGPDEERKYNVTLEDLYKGKTVKFEANKNIICSECQGSGAKENVKPMTCDHCHGSGAIPVVRQIGPTLRREVVRCDGCDATGTTVKEKDRCKRCRGKRTVTKKKMLEMYVPRGALHGETIRLEGEADQLPNHTPGDIVFQLVEEPHETFSRIGQDLSTPLKITLSEALCGFSRVVVTHLDGRGIHLTRERSQVIRPGQVLKVHGEGMPYGRDNERGDLYFAAEIVFPENGWLDGKEGNLGYDGLLALLPGPPEEIKAEEVDEVDYESDADIDEMGQDSGDPRAAEWMDDDDMGGETQCQTQ